MFKKAMQAVAAKLSQASDPRQATSTVPVHDRRTGAIGTAGDHLESAPGRMVDHGDHYRYYSNTPPPEAPSAHHFDEMHDHIETARSIAYKPVENSPYYSSIGGDGVQATYATMDAKKAHDAGDYKTAHAHLSKAHDLVTRMMDRHNRHQESMFRPTAYGPRTDSTLDSYHEAFAAPGSAQYRHDYAKKLKAEGVRMEKSGPLAPPPPSGATGSSLPPRPPSYRNNRESPSGLLSAPPPRPPTF